MNLKKPSGIVFGRGFLGTRIAEALDYELAPRFSSFNNHDLSTYLDSSFPDIVINAIGKTNIDWCEDHEEEALEANVLVALSLGIECTRRGIFFIHLGSGCIYYGDNKGIGFSEEDEPNFYGPQFYAQTKIDAERLLKNLSKQCLQLRIRMPIDDRPHKRNLIDKLKSYSGLIDVKNSMTTVPDMLEALKVLIDRNCRGIYNLMNPGVISPYEIMCMYKDIIDKDHIFSFMSLEEFNSLAGKRSNCILDSKKLRSDGIYLPEIHEAVRSCLLKYKEHVK